MPIDARELQTFADCINAAEGDGVPAAHVEWHWHYLQELAIEMRERGLLTPEAAVLADAGLSADPRKMTT